MNIAFARNEYKNTKTSSLGSKSENFEAVSVALGQLLNSMQGLREANSIEQKDAFFEKSLLWDIISALFFIPILTKNFF